ncbi:MAG: hypothetical protein ACXAEX_06650 [Promethearchaeota archaeon]|jgi:hypothetical protein
MEDYKDFSEEINGKIEEIEYKVLTGEINLLEVELVPIFENLKNSLNTSNIDKYSKTYENVFQLLIQKFEELKILINDLDRKEGFLEFLKGNPEDSEIHKLFDNCWIKPHTITTLSLDFLETSYKKLNVEKSYHTIIEHIDKIKVNQDFLLEVPEQKFTEKMLKFFNLIKNKLPCSFDEVFEDEKDQIKIYENFVYILHLLQIGKVKYQKETNYLYLG